MCRPTAAWISLVVVVFGAASCAARKPEAVASQARPATGDERGYSITTPNLVPPRVLREAHAVYTPEAMKAKVMGQVQLLVRVGADGRPERARVIKSLDQTYGLDGQAMFAVGRSMFEPATLNGKAVPVDDMPITMSFRIY